MTVYTNISQRQSFIEETPLTLGQTLAATWEDTVHSGPTASLNRAADLFIANKSESSPIIAADDARNIISNKGLRLEIPDDGIREAALNILIDRKEKENERNQRLSQGSSGFGAGVAKFGTSLIAGLVDPLNIASAFVPIVGAAKYTTMLDNAIGATGRALVRGRVGAMEGLAGAAILEPIVYGAAKYEQADYTMTQSLENLAFGAFFGGGLHMGVGALGDAFSRTGSSLNATPTGKMPQLINSLDVTTRDNAFKATIGQLAEGRSVNVEPILMYDPKYAPLRERLLMSTSLTSTPTINASAAIDIGKFELPSQTRMDIPEIRTTAPVLDNNGNITFFDNFDDAERIQKTIQRRNGEYTDIYKTDDGRFILRRDFADVPIRDGSGNIFVFDTERQANKALDAILSLKDKNATAIPFYENGEVRYTLFENASPEFIAAAKKDPTFVSFDNTKIDRWNDTSSLKSINEDDAVRLQEAMKKAKEPQQSILGSVESSVESTKYIEVKKVAENNPTTIDSEIELYTNEAQLLSSRLGLEEEYARTMHDADVLVNDAEALSKGFEAAANCSLRRG